LPLLSFIRHYYIFIHITLYITITVIIDYLLLIIIFLYIIKLDAIIIQISFIIINIYRILHIDTGFHTHRPLLSLFFISNSHWRHSQYSQIVIIFPDDTPLLICDISLFYYILSLIAYWQIRISLAITILPFSLHYTHYIDIITLYRLPLHYWPLFSLIHNIIITLDRPLPAISCIFDYYAYWPHIFIVFSLRWG